MLHSSWIHPADLRKMIRCSAYLHGMTMATLLHGEAQQPAVILTLGLPNLVFNETRLFRGWPQKLCIILYLFVGIGTDYFPGLGWMIQNKTWFKIRQEPLSKATQFGRLVTAAGVAALSQHRHLYTFETGHGASQTSRDRVRACR